MVTPSKHVAAPKTVNHTVLILVGLAALTLLVYAQLGMGEVEFFSVVDPEYITTNTHVQQGITLAGLKWAFTTMHAYNWHPLTWVSLQLDCELFGTDPRGFHFTNMLLHLTN